MPRVENMGENVQDWCDRNGRATGSTYDVCRPCFQRLETDAHAFDDGLVPRAEGEPSGLDG